MKKLLCAVLIGTLALSVGCRNMDTNDNNDVNDTNPPAEDNGTTTNPPASEAVYQDGVYRAEMDDKAADVNNGWRDYVEVTITDGKVADINFDATNTEGSLRSADTTYTMEPTLRGWLDKFIDSIKTTDNIDNINDLDDLDENVEGTENYRKLVSVALDNAKSGDTEVAIVSTDEME